MTAALQIEERGLKKGLEKGLEKGRQDEKFDIAMNMLQFGIPKEDIIQITRLTREEIDNFCSSK